MNAENRINPYTDRYPLDLENPVDLTASDILTSGGVSVEGERLKELRIRKNLTQAKLGELLGYKGRSAETIIQKWEYGERPIPTKHWKALTKILGVKLEDFLPE